MARNVNLLLDSLVVDTEYEHSKGNTEPSILNGLFKHISFEPWTEFPDIAQDAIAAIERLRDEDLEDVKDSLRQARKFISRAKRNHMRDLRLEQEKRTLFVADGHHNSVIPSFNSTELEEGSTAIQNTGMSENVTSTLHFRTRSEAKRPKHNPWYERKSVTNSTSISRLHHYVFDALGDFLEVLYRQEDLRLQQQSISSLNLLDGASEDMLRQFMERIIPPSSGESTPVSGETVSQADSQLSASEIEEQNPSPNVPLNTQSELRRVAHGTGSFSDMNAEEDHFSFPLQPLIPLNQTPDMCLFQKTLGESSNIPVCCYEFKGPTLDLSGLLAPKHSTELTGRTGSRGARQSRGASQGRRESRGRGALQGRGTSRGRGALRGRATSRRRSATRERSGVMRDGSNGDSREDNMYILGVSAHDVAGHYQELFSVNPDDIPERGTKTETKLVVLPIAQVICQAILSKSGCVFLTNHQMSFALRVEEDPAAEVFGAKVFVTGAIPSDRRPGQVASLLGFTKYCLDRIAQNSTESLLDPLRRLMMGFSYRAFHSEVGGESLDRSWCPGDEPSNASGGRSGHARTRSTRQNMAQKDENPSTNAVNNVEGCSSERTTLSVASPHFETWDCQTGLKSVSDVSSVSSGSDTESAMESKEVLKPARSKMDRRLQMLFSHSDGILAMGASGVVIKGIWAGVKVAAKMWNGHTIDGFLNLRREIKIYQRIQEKCESLLGLAVPKFFLGWDRPDAHSVYRKELVLITEYVGEAIFRNMNGRVCVETDDGFEALTRASEHGLCQSALLSLSKLHNNGFIHGDIAFRNMRAARDETSKNGWTVWWLDLGRTLEINSGASGSYLNMEIRQCRALFRLL